MSLELTFKSVCATIKKQGKDDPKLIDAVDKLLGLAFICSPAVLGPSAAALLPALELGGGRRFEEFPRTGNGTRVPRPNVPPSRSAGTQQAKPGGALAQLQIVRELCDGRLLKEFLARDMGPEFFERTFDRRHLLGLNERPISSLRAIGCEIVCASHPDLALDR